MKFKIGDTVKIISMNVPGTIIQVNEDKNNYLVRYQGTLQNYYTEDQLTSWK